MRVGRVGDRYVPASPCQVRVQGGVCLCVLHPGMEQAVSKKTTAGCREGWRSLLLPPSPSQLPLCSTSPSSPNPSILAPSPTQPLSQGSDSQPPLPAHYQHRPEDRLRKRLGQPPPKSLRPESSRVLVPSATPQPSPRYPQRPPCSCPAPYPVTPPPFRVPVAFPAPNDDDGLGL